MGKQRNFRINHAVEEGNFYLFAIITELILKGKCNYSFVANGSKPVKKLIKQSLVLSIGGGNERQFSSKLSGFFVAMAATPSRKPHSTRRTRSHVYFYNFSIATATYIFYPTFHIIQNSVQYCITCHHIRIRNNCQRTQLAH